MQVIINLVHDTIMYDDEARQGTLRVRLFDAQDFLIFTRGGDLFVDFVTEEGCVWEYPCTVTDHGKRLVVEIK